MQELISAFWNDQRTQIAVLLVALDLVLGVIAALKTKTFRLSFVSDVLRQDIVFKIGGFFAIYAGYKYAANVDLVIPGLDLEVVMNAAWGVVLLALVGSLFSSVRDLGLLPASVPDAVAGPDPETPTIPPSS